MSVNLEQDALARERITHEIDRNFFVEASAGSGKTTSVVERMTALVVAGVDVSKICAITFTKNAAREFYGRFQKRLIELSTSPETAPEVRRACEEALRNIDLCFMNTIDAFAGTILKEHPMEAGIPSGSTVCEEKASVPMLLREYVRMKQGAYSEELFEKYLRFCKVQNDPKQAFESFITKFTSLLEAEFIYTPPGDMDVDARFTDWKYKLILTLQRLQAHPEYVSCKTNDNQKIMEALPGYINTLRGEWNMQIGDVLRALNGLEGLRLTYEGKDKCLTPADINAELPEIFQQDGKRDLYYAIHIKETEPYQYLKELQYAAAVDFLASAARDFSDRLRDEGTLTFHNALLCLRDMLRRDAAGNGSLIAHISERHSYFLVDEFQDTDPLQAEIIFYLTAQKPCPEWTECVPRPGSLFIVGDPKQSIYRFKGADIGTFMRVRKLFEKGAGEILTLSRNYRSTVKLRHWFNSIFPDILQEKQEQQSGYPIIPIPEEDSDEQSSGIYYYTIGYGELKKDPQYVRAIVERFVKNPALCVFDKETKKVRQPEYKDIMILTFAKDKTAPIAAELEEHGIPTRVEGQAAFEKCPALSAGIAIFEAAAKPADALAVYKALVSPVFGIQEQTIIRFCRMGGVLSLYKKEQEQVLQAFPEIAAALSALKKHADSGFQMSTTALFDKVTDEAKVFASAGSTAMEYFCYARELLRRAEADGTILNHADGAEFLHNLLDDGGEERCLSLSKDDNRVYIANFHKVKGLEKPIVILAAPNGSTHTPDMHVVHDENGCTCYILSLQKKQSAVQTDAFQEKKQAEAEFMAAEDDRKLYVAATRARNFLIVGKYLSSKSEPVKSNPWNKLLTNMEGNVLTELAENPEKTPAPVIRSDGEALYQKAKECSVVPDSFEATYTTMLPSQMKLKPVAQEENEDVPEEQNAQQLPRNAALTGTLVHRLMECLVSGGVPSDSGALITEILHDFGVEEALYRPLLENVLSQMTNGGYPQANGTKADLLTELSSVEAVYCEVPFCRYSDNTLIHGVMDLLYRKDGVWHIVDYKTNAECQHLDEKYEEQLTAYQRAFRELTGDEAEVQIYHIGV